MNTTETLEVPDHLPQPSTAFLDNHLEGDYQTPLSTVRGENDQQLHQQINHDHFAKSEQLMAAVIPHHKAPVNSTAAATIQ